MPDPNMTYEQHLEMFGTEEERHKWKAQQEKFQEWIEQIPMTNIEEVMKRSFNFDYLQNKQ